MMFRDFLRSEHSQENLEFWFSVQEFKRELTIEKAKEIYHSYIKTGSELEVYVYMQQFILNYLNNLKGYTETILT